MSNKKRIWLGLMKSLAITPILVGGLAIATGQAADPQDGAPASKGSMPPAFVTEETSATPLFITDTRGLRVVGQEAKQPDGKQPDPKQPDPKQPDPKQPAQPPAPTAPTTPEDTFNITPPLPKLGAGSEGAKSSVSAAGSADSSGGSVGNLLSSSNTAVGVEVQKRSPLVGDPRIQGYHFGQVVTHADGGYWFPARVDLDSVVSKLNANSIQNIAIIKGPFSVRYGPGFSFLDIQSLPTPRSKNGCFEAHGSTGGMYRTNGQAWQGEQSAWGGNADWGFRISYDVQSAVDYTTGAGVKLPSGYNNQFVNFALGFDLSPDSNLEIAYLHAQQRNVLFPGLLTNINSLATDAFTARYTATKGTWYDRFVFETWVNNTSFNGNSFNPATRRQIPQLDNVFPAGLTPGNTTLFGPGGFLPVRLDIDTAGNALSYGAREITTWGDPKGFNLSLGADLRVFSNNYDEFDAFNFSVRDGSTRPANLGVPYSRQIDPGLLLDVNCPVGDSWIFRGGTRVDFTTTQFLRFGTDTDVNQYLLDVGTPRDRAYFLFSAYGMGEYKMSEEWNMQGGYGYAQRPPTLTELYTGGAFLGLIQNGLNSIYGNPELRKEEIHQLTWGLSSNYETFRAGFNTFYAFLPNYITYRNQGPFTVGPFTPNQGGTAVSATTQINRLQFINTSRATMYGFDAYAEQDVLPWLTPFATLNFTEGWDQSRDEALPGIAPLNTRVGVRFHDVGNNPRWGIEYFARMVATQELAAFSLGEARTGGFVIHNLRGYWQPSEGLMLLAGVENIGDLNYREHLDLRTGFGVFQPGINFYFGARLTY